MTLPVTPSQTIGPFSHEAWRWACATSESTAAAWPSITISGTLRDGDGAPITDGVLEAWTPGAAESDPARTLPGFRRVPSDDAGAFSLTLARPAQSAGEPAAFVTIFARGLLIHQFTAVFLEDQDLERCAILRQVPDDRRATLVARELSAGAYHWDIHMQGASETVFFDYSGAS